MSETSGGSPGGGRGRISGGVAFEPTPATGVPRQPRLSVLDSMPEVVTRYTPLLATLSMAEQVATASSPVLICGEPGTGKTLLARALHRLSGRSGPLVEVDCSAFSESALECELFGRDPARGGQGAPSPRRTGAWQAAAHGTLILDEVVALPIALQARIAHVLEQRVLARAGAQGRSDGSARVISTTAFPIEPAVREGRFRPDLFARLTAASIQLPPLRERRSDVALLADHFVMQLGGADHPPLGAEARSVLEGAAWPGNVRELREVLARALASRRGQELRGVDLPLRPASGSVVAGTALTLEELERRHIEGVLARTRWHQGRAAELLGISSKTLYRKMREYGFERPRDTN